MREELEKRRREIKQAAIDKAAEEIGRAESGSKKTLSAWFFMKETLASLGVAGFIIAFVVYYGTKASFDKASSEVGTLNQRIGAENEHIRRLDEQIALLKSKADNQSDLVTQLSLVDEVKLKKILKQVLDPNVDKAINDGGFIEDLIKCKDDLANTNAELTTTNADLLTTKNHLTTMKEELATTKMASRKFVVREKTMTISDKGTPSVTDDNWIIESLNSDNVRNVFLNDPKGVPIATACSYTGDLSEFNKVESAIDQINGVSQLRLHATTPVGITTRGTVTAHIVALYLIP